MTVSVCVATYNGARFIAAQLASILASPLVTEVLVSDDGSTDGTIEVIQSFQDERLRVLAGPGAGLIRNYEALLSQAGGEYIFLADQDDVWLPGKVVQMLMHLATADLAVSDCVVVDDQLRTLDPSFFALRGSGPGLLHNLVRNGYLGCCIAFRRRLLQHALPFPARIPMHDWWLGLIAEAYGRVVFAGQQLVLYRRHGGNVSSTAGRSQATRATQFRWRCEIAGALLARKLGLG